MARLQLAMRALRRSRVATYSSILTQHASLPRSLSTCRMAAAEATMPQFPGAIDSPWSDKMNWIVPDGMAKIPTYRVLDSENRIPHPSQLSSPIPKEEIIQWYKNMVTVNIMDSIMSDAQRHGRVSFYMVSHGEEGLMVGSAAALGPNDIITCQYREHGVFLQRGFKLKDFMSQLAANKDDPGKGRNMPNHYTGRDKVGAHSVASTLGTQIPHAVGAAYALKLQDIRNASKSPRVAVAYFGEGAASEGDFHGALNMAAMTKSPVIFLCRNNGYAISTPASEQYKGDGIASRGAGYGIPSLRVDGTDIFAVYEATKQARKMALDNEGQPVLVELMSYRLSHHSTSDDDSAYRSREEVTAWKDSMQRNPLLRLQQWLESEGLWDAEKDKQLKTQTRKDVVAALAAAEKEKRPALRSIFSDVYADMTEEAEAQRLEMKRIMEKYPSEYDIDNHVDGINGL